MKRKDGFPLFRAALGWMLCLRQTQTLGLEATMQNYQASPPDFQPMILPCALTKVSMTQMDEGNVALDQYFNTWPAKI